MELSKINARITASIDVDLIKIVKMNNWNYKDLLEFAIKFKLAESNSFEFSYPKCELKDKVEKLSNTLNEKCKEINRLKNNEIFKEEFEQTIEEDFKDAGI